MLDLIASPTCYNKFLTTIFDLSNWCCLRGSLKRDTHGRRNPRKTGCHSIFPDRIRPRQAVPLPVNLRSDVARFREPAADRKSASPYGAASCERKRSRPLGAGPERRQDRQGKDHVTRPDDFCGGDRRNVVGLARHHLFLSTRSARERSKSPKRDQPSRIDGDPRRLNDVFRAREFRGVAHGGAEGPFSFLQSPRWRISAYGARTNLWASSLAV